MIFFDHYKQYETEVEGDQVTKYFFDKQEKTLSKPIYQGFNFYQISLFFMYKAYNKKLKHFFRETHLKSHYLDTDSFEICSATVDLQAVMKLSKEKKRFV